MSTDRHPRRSTTATSQSRVPCGSSEAILVGQFEVHKPSSFFLGCRYMVWKMYGPGWPLDMEVQQ